MHLNDHVEEKRRKKPQQRRVENPRIVEECEVGDVVVLGDGRLFRFTSRIAGRLFGMELDPTHGQEGEFETVRLEAKVVLVPDYVRPDVPRPTPPHLIRSLVPRIPVPKCDWIPRGPEPKKLWRATDSRKPADAPSSDNRPPPPEPKAEVRAPRGATCPRGPWDDEPPPAKAPRAARRRS